MTLEQWQARINAAAGNESATVRIVNGEIVLSVCVGGIVFQVVYATDKKVIEQLEAA